MKWLIYGLAAFLCYLVFQHHPTLVIYCAVAYLFWRYVISPSKMTAQKQELILAKAHDIKMGKMLVMLDRIATNLDRLALASLSADTEEAHDYPKEDAYEQIHV